MQKNGHDKPTLGVPDADPYILAMQGSNGVEVYAPLPMIDESNETTEDPRRTSDEYGGPFLSQRMGSPVSQVLGQALVGLQMDAPRVVRRSDAIASWLAAHPDAAPVAPPEPAAAIFRLDYPDGSVEFYGADGQHGRDGFRSPLQRQSPLGLRPIRRSVCVRRLAEADACESHPKPTDMPAFSVADLAEAQRDWLNQPAPMALAHSEF